MSDIAIRAENISKRYKIGALKYRHNTLRDQLADGFKSLFKLNGHDSASSIQGSVLGDSIWALKDVSFEVKQGEVVGIIGRNGAGKSTLLKILSQITEPTEGRAEIYGRLGSLLEVGTGFHPELSGRENIYLNGAILGMKKMEIDLKFDEIVAFAEVEKFIDTPVKRYSSGMYVRLAFAVAAHLEPEILIVDEVLAVGDAAFQEKCLGKMGTVAKEGRTVVLVSHNMIAIRQLCKTALWLEAGFSKVFGPCGQVADAYSSFFRKRVQKNQSFENAVKGDARVQFISYRVTNGHGHEEPPPTTNQDVIIRIWMAVKEPIQQAAFGISVSNSRGVLMTSVNTVEQGLTFKSLPAGEMELSVKLENVRFLPGIYLGTVWVMSPNGHIYAMAEDSIFFEIAQSPLYGTCQVDHRWGCVYTNVNFNLELQSVTTL